MNKSVIITSTGRSGTTFLIILYTLLGFNTGYKPEEIPRCLYKCNSGMERQETEVGKFNVIKNPKFLKTIAKINPQNIHSVIIPIRDFIRSAKSREYYKNLEGGLVDNAQDYKEQVILYNQYIANYIQHMVLHEIPTTFIDFEKMVRDPDYLYSKLQPTFSINLDINVTKEMFYKCYELSQTLQSKRTKI